MRFHSQNFPRKTKSHLPSESSSPSGLSIADLMKEGKSSCTTGSSGTASDIVVEYLKETVKYK